jgi:hypothetical protein
MALRQNDRHTNTSPTAVVDGVQACEVPCKVTLRQGFSGGWTGFEGLCYRLIGDHGGRRRRMASSPRPRLRYQLLALCIDHTKESSSHRHKHSQIDDWGHLGAARARQFLHSIYWTPAGERIASPRRICDSDQRSGAKWALISAASCIFE